MHFSPSFIELIDQGRIEFIGTSGVRETGTELLQECDLAIDTESNKKRNDNTRDEELPSRWGE